MAKFDISLLEIHRSFEGEQRFYRDINGPLERDIELAIYVPDAQLKDKTSIAIYYLPGFVTPIRLVATQSDYQRYADRYNCILIIPDIFSCYTGNHIDHLIQYWQEKDKINHYLLNTLPQTINRHFRIYDKSSIMGYSFGGTLALSIALNYPQTFHSVSAFAPWIGFYDSPWYTQHSVSHQLDSNIDPLQYLLKNPQTNCPPIWIDQGSLDTSIGEEIHLDKLIDFFEQHPQQSDIWIHYRERYDHSFYFVHSYIRDHFVFHVEYHEEN